MASGLDLVRAQVDKARIPLGGQRVYKDECVYSFDTPESDEGLYVSLTSFLGFGREWVDLHFRKSQEPLYLRMKRRRKQVSESSEASLEVVSPPKKKPTRLAIGVEGGFDTGEKKVEYEEENSLVVLPGHVEIPLPCADLPDGVQLSIASVLAAETASRAQDVTAWEAGVTLKSKHAENLVQLDNGVKVPPSGWKCARCDLTNNLWMNLTDGTILCGRRYFDGSGGNNHAVEHYEETKYPLAVKLGTITPNGADVYSYDEDDMVIDPKLPQHLAHFGINIAVMEKTDKTMAELEVDINLRFEWDAIQESGSVLTPLFGAGFTGLENLGNTCYMNSTLQVLFSIPDFKERYFPTAQEIFEKAPVDPTKDFDAQMAKVAVGLLSGRYSKKPDEAAPAVPVDQLGEDEKKKLIEKQSQPGIPPRMFKTLVGKGHVEFSSVRQQDAQEYFLHLLNMIDRQSRATPSAPNPADCFKFEVEERLQCVPSGKVRYSRRDETLLALPIALDAATNLDEVSAFEARKAAVEAEGKKINSKEIVRPSVPFSSCLASFAAPEEVADFYSTATGAKGLARKTTRFVSFPDYLMVQAKKFFLDQTWVPKKLDVLLQVPDEIDLSDLRAKGLQPGEEELPAGEAPRQQEQAAFEIDEEIVCQLASMGFDMEGCKKAVFHTKNSGIEAAMNWVLEHMGDADFTSPFVPPGQQSAPATDTAEPGEEAITMVASMGFERHQAVRALKATNNNVERAVDWIFSHADELNAPPTDTPSQPSTSSALKYRDGTGKYRLVAFISHMGTSSLCGHYVCHIFKDGRWVIFNDSKVAVSEKPPRDMAYLYLFERVTSTT